MRDYVCAQYGVSPADVIRPFWPGKDYTTEDYTGKVVIDNPPFSIISKICKYYEQRGIKFFLFAPHLTLFGIRNACHVVIGTSVTYENGARIKTSFVTNFEPDLEVMTCPELYEIIKKANVLSNDKPPLPKYSYPDELITVSKLQKLADNGICVKIKRNEAVFVRKLDAQTPLKKSIFGSGILVSPERAEEVVELTREAERVQTERALKRINMWEGESVKTEDGEIVFELSEREKAIVNDLPKKEV